VVFTIRRVYHVSMAFFQLVFYSKDNLSDTWARRYLWREGLGELPDSRSVLRAT
jgi:hypothetical protein